MKKTVVFTACGFTAGGMCGLSGMPHLGATIWTLTIFGAVQASAVLIMSASGR